MKILLSAYSCLPTQGSEPGIGWNWAQCIAANGHEVFVITRTAGRLQIESYLATDSAHPVRFVYHDLGRAWQALYLLPLGNYAYYLLWQRTAAAMAGRLHAAEPFDKVQHITWGSFRVPSFMGRLGIPFTFGPVGGGEDTPAKLRKGLGWRGRLWDALRRVSGAMMTRWMESTYASASEILTATDETLRTIPTRHRHKAWTCQAVGIDSAFARQQSRKADARRRELLWRELSQPRELSRRGPGQQEASRPIHSPLDLSRLDSSRLNSSRLELLFVGRLLPWKGLHLLFKALSLLDASSAQIHLTVVGDGPDLDRLQRLVRKLKLEETIAWTGWMPRETLADIYSQCDLFAFPSLHDSGGMAVLEAMSFGLPVLCLDLGGPAMAVDDRSGRLIAARDLDEERVVASLADFLGEMMADPTALLKLSDGARSRAASLTWQANVDAVYGAPLLTHAS